MFVPLLLAAGVVGVLYVTSKSNSGSPKTSTGLDEFANYSPPPSPPPKWDWNRPRPTQTRVDQRWEGYSPSPNQNFRVPRMYTGADSRWEGYSLSPQTFRVPSPPPLDIPQPRGATGGATPKIDEFTEQWPQNIRTPSTSSFAMNPPFARPVQSDVYRPVVPAVQNINPRPRPGDVMRQFYAFMRDPYNANLQSIEEMIRWLRLFGHKQEADIAQRQMAIVAGSRGGQRTAYPSYHKVPQ